MGEGGGEGKSKSMWKSGGTKEYVNTLFLINFLSTFAPRLDKYSCVKHNIWPVRKIRG
jgi:hypothetical protein